MTMIQWAVIEMADERSVHVMPETNADQPTHVFGANCWCHPDLEKTPNKLLLVVHQHPEPDGT